VFLISPRLYDVRSPGNNAFFVINLVSRRRRGLDASIFSTSQSPSSALQDGAELCRFHSVEYIPLLLWQPKLNRIFLPLGHPSEHISHIRSVLPLSNRSIVPCHTICRHSRFLSPSGRDIHARCRFLPQHPSASTLRIHASIAGCSEDQRGHNHLPPARIHTVSKDWLFIPLSCHDMRAFLAHALAALSICTVSTLSSGLACGLVKIRSPTTARIRGH
jgi:hypothetical protein